MTNRTEHYAVVVGIDGGDASVATGARDDALKMAKWLADENGGGIPQRNLHVIASGTTPDSAKRGLPPQRFEFDRALRNIGTQAGVRIGQRLYLYLAGNAFVGGPGHNVALLMAESRSVPAADAGLDIGDCVASLADGGAFDELVVWVDAQQIDVSFPAAPLPTSDRRTAVFKMVAVSQHRGALTANLLGGLQSASSITADALRQFVDERLSAVRTELTLPNDIRFGPEVAPRVTGALVVEVPHWTAKIVIRDDRSRPVPQVGEIKKEQRGEYTSTTHLPPGIYQVEVMLDDATEEQLVFVPPAGARIRRNSWRQLKLTSAVPVSGAGARPEQASLAVQWSRISTWTWSGSAAPDSRLFIFARSTRDIDISNLFDGLTLLNHRGQPVTDFANATQSDPEAGCVVYNAALPAGYYVLRRRRSGSRPRNQPIYLCANWETHIFLAVRRNPSLRRWTYDMAPLGAGFTPDDENTLAAAAVTDALYHSTNISDLLYSGRMRHVYIETGSNPWLGVLAAYGLLQHRERLGRDVSGAAQDDSERLLGEVIKGLKKTIVDHPDVRALLLDDDKVGSTFTHPPLLRVALGRVRNYATQRPGIIPLASLTDCVIDGLVGNSAWTAWRYLNRQPQDWAADEIARRSAGERSDTSGLRSRAKFVPTPYAAVLPPSTPVFGLGAAARARSAPAGATGASSAPAGATGASSAIAGSWADAAVLQFAGTVAATSFEELPEKFVLEPDQQIAGLLAKLDPKRIAEGLGIPYDRAARVVDQLRQVAGPGGGGLLRPALVEQVIQAITEEALTGSGKTSRETWSPRQVTIEENVSKIAAQAAFWEPAAAAATDPRPAQFAARLRAVAGVLLVRADFVLLTEAAGRLLYANGAFRCLIGAAATARQRDAALRAWRAALRTAPVGYSTVAPEDGLDRVPPERWRREWQLKRIAIESTDSERPPGFLNMLRNGNPPRLDAAVLSRIAAACSELTLYGSLYGLDRTANLSYLDNVAAAIGELEIAIAA